MTDSETEPAASVAPDASPPPAMVPKERLDELNERVRQAESALRALQNQPQTSRVQAQIGVIDAELNQIAHDMQMDVGDVGVWDRFTGMLFNRQARPFLGILNGLADRLDDVHARVRIADYTEYEPDIEKERQQALTQQKYLSREEAYHLVRSRRLPDLLEKERQRATETRTAREEQAHSATATTGDGIAKAGPTQTRRVGELSREEYLALPLEEKEQYLEGKPF